MPLMVEQLPVTVELTPLGALFCVGLFLIALNQEQNLTRR